MSGIDDGDDTMLVVVVVMVVVAKEERKIGKGGGKRGEGGRMNLSPSAPKPNKKIDTPTPTKDMKLVTAFTLCPNPL